MKSNREKILIIKSDKIGDFINFSPCLKILKDNKKNCHISVICSEYNVEIVRNYKYIDNLIVFKSKFLFVNLLKNFRILFFTNYDYLFQYDGKNSSYFTALFIRSRIKSTICFIKQKTFVNLKFNLYRPNKFILKFFKNSEYSNENYSYNSHYQSIYFKLLENLNFKISSKQNLFFLDNAFEPVFNQFCNSIVKNYILFHFDEKWDAYNKIDRTNVLKIINIISSKNNVVITLGIKNFLFIKELKNNFSYYNFINKKFVLIDKKVNKKVFLLNNIPLNLLAFFVKNSLKNISSHAGSVVHMSAAFGKQSVDIIKKDKNKEYDRWIPLVADYKRINLDEINDNYLKNFEI